MIIPEITTDRLILRPLRLEDAEDMYTYAQDERVARPGMWEPYASFEQCQEHVEQLVGLYEKGLMWWGLEHRESGRLIGRVQLSEWSRHDARAELSYALNRDHWGQGLMSEAVSQAVDFGWGQLGLQRISATVIPTNAASIRVLTRIGMTKEGTLRRYRRLWSEWLDIDVYAVLKDEGRQAGPISSSQPGE